MPWKTTPKVSEALANDERMRSVTHAKTTVQNDRLFLNHFIQGVGDRQCHLFSAAACEDWFAEELSASSRPATTRSGPRRWAYWSSAPGAASSTTIR